MAAIREVTVKLSGSIRSVDVDADAKGNHYATVQVENDGGISDVTFNADQTRRLNPASWTVGTPVDWTVRPYIRYGIAKRTGQPYGFSRLSYVDDPASEF